MKKILIINSNYYKKISDNLVLKAKDKLLKTKFKVKILEVPGVHEIPIAIRKNIKKFDAFVALGCVIKGKTPHFNFISSATTNAIMQISITHQKPIGNGILNCLNINQALKRSDVKNKDKGGEAAKAVLSVLGILKNE